ncbi:MAG: efflux RND transporter periplasmic adaptor subunit [Kiritimatiellae bacterium]|nr:efflux RND transporter periplasmic adaptor subunit [Verrucomicrobiota bacterium]MBU4286061.1 efflux RND transporter periplasmic adaptor subunit [Verrucomicrobiota bacterium]MBU4366801.1 efflux RND transporter periplasmic adaptor subunit [Verrucomicrobiota bacterium]MCG2661838.1 efflux RND transporter periplasmic adaptor subunit [Kiritimatiellia bacterium]
MKQAWKYKITLRVATGLLAVTVLWLNPPGAAGSECGACGDTAAKKAAAPEKDVAKAEAADCGAQGNEAAEAGHGHGGHKSGGDPVATALANCEHKVPLYQCAECRYEAGVVKADASLWKNEKGGLLTDLTVSNRKVRAAMTLTGEVRLNENAAVHLSPRVAGVIESVAVDIGATVKVGDELFAINSMEFGRALSDYERSRALTALSEKNYAREKTLVAQKASPEQDLIAAQMTYEQHRTELRAAEQTLHVMGLTEENVTRLQDGAHGPAVSRLATRAPLSGTVVERHAVIGELVEPGKDVMLIADLTTMWVWANVHERDLAALVKAREVGPIPVSIMVNAYPGRTFAGKIDYIGVTVDEQTRTVKVRATVANTDRALRPGMFCEVRAALGAEEEALTVPRAALLSDEGQDFVFAHWKDDYFMRRFITKGRDFVEHIEVRDGLKPGERIVAEGAFLLKSDILREKMGAGCAD